MVGERTWASTCWLMEKNRLNVARARVMSVGVGFGVGVEEVVGDVVLGRP